MTDRYKARQEKKFKARLTQVVHQVRSELRARNVKFVAEDDIYDSYSLKLKNVCSGFDNVSIIIVRKSGSSCFYTETDIIITVSKCCGYGRGSDSSNANFRARKDGEFNIDQIIDRAQAYAKELRSEIRTRNEIDRMDKKHELGEKKVLRRLKISKKIKAQQSGNGQWCASINLSGLVEEDLMILSDAVKQVKERA